MTLKRKGSPFAEPQKKARAKESSQAVLTRAMPTLKPVATVSSPVLSEEAAPSAPIRKEEVVERKKKKAIGKKVG
ncbi:hypothetical protein COCNU_scaffold001067G000020 [Cocos nucifera]|nr:hypothetical protein [Cocos nucifera]